MRMEREYGLQAKMEPYQGINEMNENENDDTCKPENYSKKGDVIFGTIMALIAIGMILPMVIIICGLAWLRAVQVMTLIIGG